MKGRLDRILVLAFATLGCDPYDQRSEHIPEPLRERAISGCLRALRQALPFEETPSLSRPTVVRLNAQTYSVRGALNGVAGLRYVECSFAQREGSLDVQGVSFVEW